MNAEQGVTIRCKVVKARDLEKTLGVGGIGKYGMLIDGLKRKLRKVEKGGAVVLYPGDDLKVYDRLRVAILKNIPNVTFKSSKKLRYIVVQEKGVSR